MVSSSDIGSAVKAAFDAISNAEALLIGAGAGMGVDSGLPDFRGPEGFWKAYPPFRGRRFAEISTPHWFRTDPALAWGFFGHRLNLYRAAVPHRGFEILRHWAQRCPFGCFVFTSNVDGQFQKAGFPEDSILECHGSVHVLQCTRCAHEIWSADGTFVEVNEETIRAAAPLPTCPGCGAIARPNVLMFNDGDWDSSRTDGQQQRYHDWLRRSKGRRIVAIELGAGLAIPTVRVECQTRADLLVRINPREAEVSAGISVPLGALEALESIDSLLQA